MSCAKIGFDASLLATTHVLDQANSSQHAFKRAVKAIRAASHLQTQTPITAAVVQLRFPMPPQERYESHSRSREFD